MLLVAVLAVTWLRFQREPPLGRNAAIAMGLSKDVPVFPNPRNLV
jgi:hypothetical protein